MAWIEKIGKRYYVYWRDHGKKYSKPAGEYKQTAIELRNRIAERVIRKDNDLIDPKRTLLSVTNEYIEVSKKTKKSKTIAYHSHCLKICNEYFKNQKILSITPQHIEQFKIYLLAKYKPNGASMILRSLKACMNFAIKTGVMRNNPVKGIGIKAQPVAKFMVKDQIDTLLMIGCKHNKELANIIKIAIYTGLRLGEILGIRATALKEGYILIQNTKTGYDRKVPIHQEIKEILKNPVFLEKWNFWRIQRAFRRAIKRSNLPRFRFHDLRHTFCSRYLECGGTIADLREITGHRSLEMLKVYAHFQQSHLKERIQAINF